MVLGTDGQRAVVNWINALGESFRSVGEGNDSRVLVFDYFGSWSEAPGSALVDLQDAARCLERFVMTGAPDTESVLFAPD